MKHEYSEAEHRMFRHFKTEYLCDHLIPYSLYNNTMREVFLFPNKFDEKYIHALRDSMLTLEKNPCRMTPEFDKIIIDHIGE